MKKSFLWLVVVLLSLATIFFLGGCAAPPGDDGENGDDGEKAGGEGYTLAVLIPGTVEFFNVETEGMDEAAAELGVTLKYADGE